jgi:hypothetical protein
MPSCFELGTAQPLWTSLNSKGGFTRTATAKMSQVDHVSYHMTLPDPFFLLLNLCVLCGEGSVSSAGVDCGVAGTPLRNNCPPFKPPWRNVGLWMLDPRLQQASNFIMALVTLNIQGYIDPQSESGKNSRLRIRSDTHSIVWPFRLIFWASFLPSCWEVPRSFEKHCYLESLAGAWGRSVFVSNFPILLALFVVWSFRLIFWG